MEDRTAASRRESNERWLERVDFALRKSGLEQAAQLSLEALADGAEHPALLNLAASTRYSEGKIEEAERLLGRARRLAPEDPNVLNSLGVCLTALGKFDAALEAYDAAIRIDPRMAPAHFNRGTVLEQIDDIHGARSAYAEAAALDPEYVDPIASIAWLDALSGDTDSARANAQRSLTLSSSNVLARMALASAELQQGDLKNSEARLWGLIRDPRLTRLNRAIVAGLMGDLLDAQGRPAEAFGAYRACNAELEAIYAAQFHPPNGETALGRVRRLAAWFEDADPAEWFVSTPFPSRVGIPTAHVFLVGFPRSGTTLLENVLAAHPDVVTLEEKDCLAAANIEFLGSDDGLRRLASIDTDHAEHHRDLYWSAVRRFGIEPNGRVFIDKLPLASIQLPIIAKLFPNARVLFARRDPRDVVLSCFRRRFALNSAMYQLLTLEGAAAYYDAVMGLSERYRELLTLPVLDVRYESLVDDFESTVRAACEFVGLDWDHGMLDFAEKARTRGIATPSASQVARGLNREGRGVWRRYREQMEPVLPLLEPWVRRLGYISE